MLEAYLAIMASMLALILLLAPLGRLAPAEKGQPSRRLLFNLLYGPVFYTFALAVGISAAPFLLAAAALATGGWILSSPGAGLAGQLLLALAFAFVWDLSQYGFHRLQHRIPFLWETHRFHHEETALSAAAYPRAHFLAVFGVVLFNLPLFALFGTQVPHAAAAFLLFPSGAA